MRRIVILGLLAVLLAMPPPHALAASPNPGGGNVSAAVSEAISARGSARVNITLSALPSGPHARADLVSHARTVQGAVLGRLAKGDFETIYRYAGLPALTGTVTRAGLAKLAADPAVMAITLDAVGHGAGELAPLERETAAPSLSHSVPMIGADVVQSRGITGSGVTVAILDSGADTDHPDLVSSIVGQECFLTGSGSHCPDGTTRQSGPGAAEDDLGHGSNVAGIVTSDGIVSSPGVAPGASVFLYKILNSSNSGQLSDWDAALSDIIANHPEVRVINMSLVTSITFAGDCSSFDPTTAAAFQTLTANGVTIFVSSGNDGAKSSITYPACIPGAVSVGAVFDQSFSTSTFFGCTDTPATIDTPTCWSNSRPDLALLAPGTFIISDGLDGGTSDFIGTSQASPHAAGTAALLLQASPAMTPDQIIARLETSGVARTDPANGIQTPRIDALAAVFPDVPSVGGIAETATPLAAHRAAHHSLLKWIALGAAIAAAVAVSALRIRALRRR